MAWRNLADLKADRSCSLWVSVLRSEGQHHPHSLYAKHSLEHFVRTGGILLAAGEDSIHITEEDPGIRGLSDLPEGLQVV